MEELKDEGSIHICSGGSHNPHVALVCVEVAGTGNVCDRRAHSMTSMDDTHTEGIHGGSTACMRVCVGGEVEGGREGGRGGRREGGREGK